MDFKIIENASLYDIRPGDHIIWERTWMMRGVTGIEHREGTAHHRNQDDDWCTEDGMWIAAGEGEGIDLTIHRPINDLPTDDGAVIVPIVENGVVEAGYSNIMYTTRHATYDSLTDTWVGLWKRTNGDYTIARMSPGNIIKTTWKKKED